MSGDNKTKQSKNAKCSFKSNFRHWCWDNMAAISQTAFSNAFFLNENIWIWLKISLKFVPKFRFNNIPTLLAILAWRRPGDKPLSGPMIVSLLTHICVIRPQWVNERQVEYVFNTLKPRQNGCHITEDVFKSIFLNQNLIIFNKNTLRFKYLDTSVMATQGTISEMNDIRAGIAK